MKLRLFLPALALVFVSMISASAKAQVGVYLNPTFAHIGISTPDYGPFSFLGDGQTSRWFGGVAMGGYWDFHHARGYSAGLDVRDTIIHGNNASLNTFSFAARVEGHPIHYGVKPYAQLAIGAGHSKPELSTRGTTRAEWGIFGGLDYPVAKHLDFRAIEVGYGTVTTISSSVVGNGTNIPGAKLLRLSSGIVVRFGK